VKKIEHAGTASLEADPQFIPPVPGDNRLSDGANAGEFAEPLDLQAAFDEGFLGSGKPVQERHRSWRLIKTPASRHIPLVFLPYSQIANVEQAVLSED